MGDVQRALEEAESRSSGSAPRDARLGEANASEGKLARAPAGRLADAQYHASVGQLVMLAGARLHALPALTDLCGID